MKRLQSSVEVMFGAIDSEIRRRDSLCHRNKFQVNGESVELETKCLVL